MAFVREEVWHSHCYCVEDPSLLWLCSGLWFVIVFVFVWFALVTVKSLVLTDVSAAMLRKRGPAFQTAFVDVFVRLVEGKRR